MKAAELLVGKTGMHTKNLHSWDLNYKQAVDLQNRLAARVRFVSLRKKPKIIAGLDCAFSKDGRKIFAVAVVMKLGTFEIIETKSAVRKVTFPYIPGLTFFLVLTTAPIVCPGRQ